MNNMNTLINTTEEVTVCYNDSHTKHMLIEKKRSSRVRKLKRLRRRTKR